MRLILVRHAATVWTDTSHPLQRTVHPHNRLLGSSDVPLSTQGIQQATQLGARLAQEGITHLITSPLQRAYTTAKRIAPHIGPVPMTIEPRLQEIDFGAAEGLTLPEVARRYPDVYHAYCAQGNEVEFPRGEAFSAFQERVHHWLEEFLATYQDTDETVLIVTHGGVTRVALCILLAWPIETFWRIRQDYACINSIGVYGTQRIIEQINGT